MTVSDFEDHCWKDIVPPEILEIYGAYRREMKIGPKPALLMIDHFNLVFEGGARPVLELQKDYPSSCGEYAWAAIPSVRTLLLAARAAGIPVIHCTQDARPEAGLHNGAATLRKGGSYAAEQFEIFHEFSPEPGEIVITKQRASIFHGTPLQTHLTQLGVRSLIVSGESTSGCLRASVVDGYSFGYQMSVVEECCYDRGLLSHKVSLFDLHHKYADVLHLDDALMLLKKALEPAASGDGR